MSKPVNLSGQPFGLLLIGLVVALLWALGVRLPMRDTAAALLALVVAGLIWRYRT